MPADYEKVLDEMEPHNGMVSLSCAQKLAAKAYARTAAYDAAISNWFAETLHDDAPDYPRLRRQIGPDLALWREPASDAPPSIARPEQRFGVATARQLQGKELSYNNINDTDAAYECVAEFDPNALRPA